MTAEQEGLSASALRALREAATLASVARDVRVRIGDGRRTVVEVRRPPFGEGDPGVLTVPPCRFRVAVGAAHAQHAAGQGVVMAGLETLTDPVVHVGLAPTDAVLPGDIYRLYGDDEWTLLLATDLELDAAMGAAASLDDAVFGACGNLHAGAHVRIGFHYDDLTAMTLVHTSVRDHGPATRDHLAAIESVLACCVVEELARDLGKHARRG
jgi:hypothetical protein